MLLALLATAACSSGGDTEGAPPTSESFEEARASENRVFLQCAEDHGVPAEVNPDGNVDFDTGAMSREQVEDFTEECFDRLEAAGYGGDDEPPTETELRDRYHHETQLRNCLQENGFPVGEWVTEEQYLATAGAVPHPFVAIAEASDEDWERANTLCPQNELGHADPAILGHG